MAKSPSKKQTTGLSKKRAASAKPKSKKHGIGLSKEKITMDPTGHTQSTVTVLVDELLDQIHVRDGHLDSSTHKWIGSAFYDATPLSSPAGADVATAVRITGYCLRKKRSSTFDGDGDLIVSITYDDTATGDTETDECTFTDVEY